MVFIAWKGIRRKENLGCNGCGMAGMAAGMLEAAKGRKESGLMVAGGLSNQEMLVDSCWDACSSQNMEVDGWDGCWNACSNQKDRRR
ncbi:hypothetical protein Pyn_26079 [Prunus yedoensis var. nudiflora]|uniref:Uncharacterized protein n=1 Tax=Prunus yedoensis var. nudiflora TaxID=2094558 RepID=A0A314YD26_PRUYE|nr:hypothetical protein Pyn_26079 [Prunus yedoensis var. nudiflora]